MCGIVGLMGKIRTVDHDRFAREAVLVDTLRGGHATGVMHMYYDPKDKEDLFVNTYKEAVPGWEFVQSTKGHKILTCSTNSLAVVAHNRYATGGGMQDEHAHPFTYKNITLVHNGVLDNWRELMRTFNIPTSVRDPWPTVDSASVAMFLAHVKDPTEVLEAIEGAYSFVWFNSEDNTLNFARNAERPMWFANAGDVSLFGSEKDLLSWVGGRNKIDIKSFTELPVGTHLSLTHDLNDGLREVGVKSFKAGERKKWQYDYRSTETSTHGGRGSSAGNSSYRAPLDTGTSSGSSTSGTNLSGHTYSQLIQYLQNKLRVLGVVPGIAHDWQMSHCASEGKDRYVMELVSVEVPDCRAIKYMYAGTSTADNKDVADMRILESCMRKVAMSQEQDITGIVAEPASVILYGEAQNSGWQAMTSEEVLQQGLYRFLFKTETVRIVGIDESGTYKTLFDARAASRLIISGQSPITKDELVLEKRYRIRVDDKTLQNIYKGNSWAVYKGMSTSNPHMARVQPCSNAGVTMLVPLTVILK
jgi:hypothetical protein